MTAPGWWICPVCRTANPPTAVTCSKTADHDGQED